MNEADVAGRESSSLLLLSLLPPEEALEDLDGVLRRANEGGLLLGAQAQLGVDGGRQQKRPQWRAEDLGTGGRKGKQEIAMVGKKRKETRNVI